MSPISTAQNNSTYQVFGTPSLQINLSGLLVFFFGFLGIQDLGYRPTWVWGSSSSDPTPAALNQNLGFVVASWF